MKNLFKPEDFQNIYKQLMRQGYMQKGAGDMWEPSYRPEDIAKEVNEKLNALIESWPVLYTNCPDKYFIPEDSRIHTWNTIIGWTPDMNYKARLAFIEPIVKEPCKHEAEAFEFAVTTEGFLMHGAPNTFHRDKATTLVYSNKCKHCGVDLVTTWTAK